MKLSRKAQTRFEAGCAEHGARQYEKAEASFRAVLQLAPGHAPSLGNLAEVLRAKGDLPASLAAFREALAATPAGALLHNNHASALLQIGQLDAAVAELQLALSIDPTLHRAKTNLANALLSRGQNDEARALLEEVLRETRDSWPALASLGALLVRTGSNEQALAPLLRALEIEPRAAEARATLASCLTSLGFVEEALEQYRSALQLLPGNFTIWSAYLFTLHCGAGTSPEAIAAESARFGEALERSVAPRRSDRLHTNQRLRVGYVSPDLRGHPVGFFLAPVLEAHDRAAFEIFAYSDTRSRDATHQRIRSAVDHFCDAAGLSDAQLADQIERDQIDLLVDLAGHTTGHRLAVFARKPAPVQLSWLGYPDTTGLRAIDFRITDAIADPDPGGPSDALYTERLVRLPHCFIAWSPENARPASRGPLEKPIAFGSFNNIAKLSPRLAQLWTRIVHAVPESKLFLKSRGLALEQSRAHLLGWFERAGLARDRIVLLPFARSPEDALRDYNQLDIALDPFSYNGTTTSCEALSMGVPLVALRGKSHAARVSASILESIGARELVAESEDAYAELAVSLARDRARLALLHRELPARFASSPVGDPKRLARELEETFRACWQEKATGQGGGA